VIEILYIYMYKSVVRKPERKIQLGDFGKTGRAWVCGGEVGSSGGLL
jgi:hypothetical protein